MRWKTDIKRTKFGKGERGRDREQKEKLDEEDEVRIREKYDNRKKRLGAEEKELKENKDKGRKQKIWNTGEEKKGNILP